MIITVINKTHVIYMNGNIFYTPSHYYNWLSLLSMISLFIQCMLNRRSKSFLYLLIFHIQSWCFFNVSVCFCIYNFVYICHIYSCFGLYLCKFIYYIYIYLVYIYQFFHQVYWYICFVFYNFSTFCPLPFRWK